MREATFIGRRGELADLASAAEAASQGRGTVALVAGEAGIGKTRLADELSRVARDGGATVAWGRCWEAGGTPAYWPWTQVLRALIAARGAPRESVERAAGERAPDLVVDLAPLVPELASGKRRAPSVADPMLARFRLFDGATMLLRTLSQTSPIVIVLDDLHSADLSTLHLLHFVARELRSMRILIVGTYREAEARSSPERMDLLTRIAREGAVFPLTRLDSAEVAALVRGELPGEAHDDLVRVLQRSSEGNPLFLCEMLRLISGGARPSSGTYVVPDTVHELLRRRLATLDEPTRSLIEFASVFGREFQEPLLIRVAHLEEAALRQRLTDAASAGLVVDVGDERWTFSHILIREALYASIPFSLRARLHAALADGLEEGSEGSSSDLSAIAHHRLLGAPESGIRQAIESALALSERALSMFAFEDVVGVLENVLRRLEAAPGEDDLRARALVMLAEASVRLGHRARGKRAGRDAAEIFRARGDVEGLAQAALAYGIEFSLGEVDPVLVRLLEEAREGLESGNPALHARVSARLAAARQPAHDVTEPMVLAREAIAQARTLGDDDTLRAVLHFALAALVDYAEPEEVVPLCEESIALAKAAGDKTYLLRGQTRMVFASLELGDLARTDAAIAAYESLALELTASHYVADAMMMRSMRSLMNARFDEYEDYVRRAREIRDPTAEAYTRASALFADVGRDFVRERQDRIVLRMSEMAEVMATYGEVGLGYVHVTAACAHARLGDVDAARRHLERIADDAVILTGEPIGERLAAEAVARVGDVRRAALLESRMVRMKGRILTWGRTGMVCDAPVTRLLGLLAGVQGRHAEATALLEDALERARAMGLVSLLPRIGLELATELLRGETAPEIERAHLVLAEVERQAEVLGYDAITAMARAAPAPARAPSSARARTPVPTPQTAPFRLVREGELYTVEAPSGIARLKDSLGMRLLERLVMNPSRELHVLELVGMGEATPDRGDAGELLDERAMEEYRTRLQDLRDAAREAEEFGDVGRRTKAEAEIGALTDELARGLGLGGRQRRAGAAAERARINVQRRVRDAIRRIEEQLPEVGRHLSWAVKTGTFCSYSPDRR